MNSNWLNKYGVSNLKKHHGIGFFLSDRLPASETDHAFVLVFGRLALWGVQNQIWKH